MKYKPYECKTKLIGGFLVHTGGGESGGSGDFKDIIRPAPRYPENWLTQDKIDNGPDAPPINISAQQPRWYHKLVLWILCFAAGYILWQAIKLIIFYYGQYAINTAIRG